MTKHSQQSGMTAVEVLITLFIAAAFLMSGYQLYSLIIKDNGEARALSKANNIAYDYLQQFKSQATDPCTTVSGLPTNESITVDTLTNVTYTVAITCPYPAVTSISKITVTVKYNNDTPQKTITNATYVKL